MRYTLYIPCGDHEGAIPPDLLTRCGLHVLEDDCGPEVCWVNRGDWGKVRRDNKEAVVPSGDGNGRLATWRCGDNETDAPRLGTPEFGKLTWYCSPASTTNGWPMFSAYDPIVYERGAYWIGVDKENMPNPSDTERAVQFPGYSVSLGDGHGWNIPGAWCAPASCGVDMETGFVTEVIGKKWKSYCRTAAEHAEEFFRLDQAQVGLLKLYSGVGLTSEEARILAEYTTDGKTPKKPDTLDVDKLRQVVQLNEVIEQAWVGLMINYRIHPVIATLLKLFPTIDHAISCCVAAFDRQRIGDALKKNEVVRLVTIPYGLTMFDGQSPLTFAP